jgi:glycosyltransferase involved in cell wall biosynthesis
LIRPAGGRLWALLPIYNEAASLEGILQRVASVADCLVLVDDGSSDDTPRLLERFMNSRAGVYVLRLPKNRGMAGALEAGFKFVLYLLEKGEVTPDDVLVTMDADGQHRPENLPEGKRRLIQGRLDVLLTRRDFRVYPLYKVLGNRFLTWTNRLLSGFPYHDVESGMRFIRVGALPAILKYYLGHRYSCAQEIALLSVRQGLRVRNDYQVDVPIYRAGTTLWDGFIVLAYSLTAYARWRWDRPVHRVAEGDFFQGQWKRCHKSWPQAKRRGRNVSKR